MKITYYGTAAGEAWPGVFCRCELCERARALGGRNIRTRSQALVNDDLLLDLPPENHMHSLLYGLDLSRVEALLFTHNHSDHCYPEDLELLRPDLPGPQDLRRQAQAAGTSGNLRRPGGLRDPGDHCGG